MTLSVPIPLVRFRDGPPPELAEQIHEWSAQDKATRAAFDKVLAGHPADVCACTGCQIARLAHIWVRTAAEPDRSF